MLLAAKIHMKAVPIFYRGCLGFIALFALAGCNTPEFKTQKNICESKWMQKIPPNYQQRTYNRTMSRQVPSGHTSCYTLGNFINCDQTMRTEYYVVPAVRTVDLNKSRRDDKIKACTRQLCNKKYGNSKCE